MRSATWRETSMPLHPDVREHGPFSVLFFAKLASSGVLCAMFEGAPLLYLNGSGKLQAGTLGGYTAGGHNVTIGVLSTKCRQFEMLSSLQMCSKVPGSTCPSRPLPSESCAIRGPPCTYRAGAFRSARKMRMPATGGVGLLAPQTPINDSLDNRRLRALRCRVWQPGRQEAVRRR